MLRPLLLSLAITISSSSFSAADPFALTDTQGRTIDVEIISIQEESVTFTVVGHTQEHTVGFERLTAKTIAELTATPESDTPSENQIAPENLFDVTLITKTGAKVEHVVITEVNGDTVSYFVAEHAETRKSPRFDLKLHKVRRDKLKEGASITLPPPNHHMEVKIIELGPVVTYEVTIPQSPVHQIKVSELSPESQVIVSAVAQIQEVDVQNVTIQPIAEVTPSDKEFNDWITTWYQTEYFNYGVPQEIQELFWKNPELRIEFMDAVTTEEEAKTIPAIRKNTVKPTADHLINSAQIVKNIHTQNSEKALKYISLLMALSLISDESNYATEASITRNFTNGQMKEWLTAPEEVFAWKTNPQNMEKFEFLPNELNINQNTWANNISQTSEDLTWALTQTLEWGLFNTGKDMTEKVSLQTIKTGRCTTLSYLLEQKLLARNQPTAYTNGRVNTKLSSHAMLRHFTKNGVTSTADGNLHTSGTTTLPTNNAQVPDGFFVLMMSPRYNSELSQKLRVKTQYANTLIGEERIRVLKDIVAEDPNFGEAWAELYLANAIEELPTISEPLDNAVMHQKLFFDAIQKQNRENATKHFDLMLEGEPNELIRLAWGISTLKSLEPVYQLYFAPQLPPYIPSYPATFAFFIYNPLNNGQNKEAWDASWERTRAASPTREFSKLASLTN